MLGVVIQDFRGEEGNSHGDGKQMFGKEMFPRPCKDNGTQRNLTNLLGSS